MENITRNANEVKTGNTKLNNAIKAIDRELEKGRKSGLEICRQLAKIKTENLFETVSESFSEFCETWWKLSKSQGTRLANVGEKFLLNSDEYNDYNSSQLVAMLNATDEQLKLIDSKMTVKQIRDILNPKPAIEDNSDEDENTDITDNSTDETEDNIPDESNTIDIDDGFVIARNEDGSYSVSIYNINGLTNFAKFAESHKIKIDNNHSIDFDI